MPSTSTNTEEQEKQMNPEDVPPPDAIMHQNPGEEIVEEEVPEGEEVQLEEEEVEEIIVVNEEDLLQTGDVEGEEIIFAEEEDYDIEYDASTVTGQQTLLFKLYQPQITPHGTLVCKICARANKMTEYPDRNTFVAHRYKCHGSFNNNVLCPVTHCREVYASLYTLRRHLSQDHQLPIEIHLQTFTNIGEFEKFRHLIELASGCRYMMHTKQPKYRRQVMHCAKSEHKLVLQTQKTSRHRLPREKMQKEGAACPSVISYRVDANSGEVSTFMQLFHVGHAPDSDAENSNADTARPMDIVFPLKPSFLADHPMQYVQIDVHEMPTAVYGSRIYETFLVVTCLKSKFMWARPLIECTRSTIGQVLNSIFNEYGVPEGFSTTFHPTYIRDAMKTLESVYSTEIREVWNEPIPYIHLERWVLDLAQHDLHTRNRWVEQLQFVVMEYNQKPLREYSETPFEKMFGRKAPNLYHNGEREDLMTAKCIVYLLELRKEVTGINEDLDVVFEPGQKVFLRKGITKPRRGNNTQFYFGYVSDYDPSNRYYPYKVHFAVTDSPWPTERSQHAWVSVFDLLPTIHGISEMTANEKRESIANYMCVCPGDESNKNFDMSAVGKPARAASRCLLFRNLLCTNNMSKYCCKTVGPNKCKFHDIYPENEESYAKMDTVLKNYLDTVREDEEKKEGMQEEPIRRMVREEDDIQMRLNGEEFDMMDDYAPPPTLERHRAEGVREEEREEDPQGTSSSERIDIEGIDEEGILEPAVPLEDHDFEYEEEPKNEPSTSKRGRKSPNERMDETTPQKRQKTSESEASRRASGRRTIRPKILEDYVVE